MSIVKSLLLGSAAGLVAVAGAQAADLPAKSKAVEYVKVCDAYGAGFYYVPGTDICLKVGGYLRVDMFASYGGAYAPTYAGQRNLTGYSTSGNVSYDRGDNLMYTRSRAAIDLDARTRTEYGTLRSYSRIYVSNETYNNAKDGVTGTGYAVLDMERAFIQFAGFTFGYVQSFFDYSTGLGTFATLHVGSNRWNTAFAYTASLGNGLSATIALEDATYRRNAIGVKEGTITTTAFNDLVNYSDGTNNNQQAGQAMPDIVANIRVDQSWGSAQLSGAIHQLRSNSKGYLVTDDGEFDYYMADDFDTAYGFAIGAGVTFNVDSFAKGDQFVIQGSYTDGAIEYTGVSANPIGGRNGIGLVRGYNGAVVDIADAYVDFWGNIQTVEAWTVRADFRHFWTPSLRSTLFGGYTSVEAPAILLASGTPTNGYNDSEASYESTIRDFNIWQVGFNTTWSPVKNLDIGVELLYSKIEVGGSFDPYWGKTWYQHDEDIFVGMMRVQRNF